MPFVLDASITAAWLLPDETHAMADAAEERMLHDHAVVPAVWALEVHNLLLVCERRGRHSRETTDAILANLSDYPIFEDAEGSGAIMLELARQNLLSIYDASYLELAMRLKIPLATLDKALQRAAAKHDVPLI